MCTAKQHIQTDRQSREGLSPKLDISAHRIRRISCGILDLST